MIGKAEVKKWRYDFDCHRCSKVKYVKDDIRDGLYCMPMVNGLDPIHADNDRVVRCDEYVSDRPDQMSLF